ncbi:MAG TPA: transcriptional regulator [Bacteroides graminisolvens]|uniref:Transcriptional regulator n=1 Tax=Bacteroides graminisolvens TaxID=477666 RepID=A0A3D2SAR8_9BACE|nr:transcriptional regulator [Bacteroides graminisolvens]
MKLNRIKDVLEAKGISQTWLSKRLNKSYNSVNAYVCNRTQPNLEILLLISNILEVDMKDLISDADDRNE